MADNKIAMGLSIKAGSRVVIRAKCQCGALASMVLPKIAKLPCTGCRWEVEDPARCLGCSRNPRLLDKWEL